MTTLHLPHRENEMCGFKKCQSSVKKKDKKTSSNEEFISEGH